LKSTKNARQTEPKTTTETKTKPKIQTTTRLNRWKKRILFFYHTEI
jgi:hypothetical protein